MMSQSAYDAMWRSCVGTLNEQLRIEGAVDDSGGEDSHEAKAIKKIEGEETFPHYASLYIKYLQIFRKLESCYDCMIHPQKRVDTKLILELVIRRVIELKHELVLYNPRAIKVPAARENIHLVDILVDLKLSTDKLEVPIPKYFCEDNKKRLEYRNKIITGYMLSNLNKEAIYLPESDASLKGPEMMTTDQAIEIIQKNERGRQGVARGMKFKMIREGERRSLPFDGAVVEKVLAKDAAAICIQKFARGITSRKNAIRERQNELKFVGMMYKKDHVEYLASEAKVAYLKKKQQQVDNKLQYEGSLAEVRSLVLEENGPDIKESWREERMQWITEQIAQEKFPTELPRLNAAGDIIDEAKAEPKESKSSKGDKKSSKEGGDDRKSSSKLDEAVGGEKSLLLADMRKAVVYFDNIWASRDESNNFGQTFDMELTKEIIHPDIERELRNQVDAMLEANLVKITLQLAPMKKGKKDKGKKKGKKGKKEKGKKKGKPLPGDKIAEMKTMDIAQMLSLLIENELVVCGRNVGISSILGDFNYLDKPQDPSFAQLRQAISEYCILPNGSEDIKKGLMTCTKKDINLYVKSVLLYGPSGSGKTLAVEAVATELGAMIIHLTPEKLNKMKTTYAGKSGATKIIHMAFKVATDPVMQPDECEEFFFKKSKDKEGPSRFKKDLLTYKNQAILPEHRVIIMGASRFPERADPKDLKSFFDKSLFFPYPDYSTRVLVWRHFYAEQIRSGLRRPQDTAALTNEAEIEESINMKVRGIVESMDVSSLAFISEGYSVGSIARTVRQVVTSRRVAIINQRPLSAEDFIDILSSQEYTYENDKEVYMAFGEAISGMEQKKAVKKKGGGKKKK